MFNSVGLKRVLLLSLVLSVCCISGFFSIHLSHKWEKERRLGAFNELAEIYGDHLTSEIKSIQASIPSISANIEGNLLPSKGNFHTYVSEGNVLYSKAKFFGLVLEVPIEKRADIYTAVKVANGRLSVDEEGRFIQPPDNEETYYPIIYVDAGKAKDAETVDAIQSLQGQNALNILDGAEVTALMRSEDIVLSNYLPSLSDGVGDDLWFYMATPVDILLDVRDQTSIRGVFFLGMDLAGFIETALQDLANQDLVFYMTGASDDTVSPSYTAMRFADGKVEALPYEIAKDFLSQAEMRYDEVVDLSRGGWPFSIIPRQGSFMLEWKQVITGYVAAAGLIMFGLLASYFTIIWNVNLESLVQKRTEQLENMRKKAEGANKAKSEFLANMSHELRTPLNAVIGFSDIMKSGMIKDDAIESYQEYAGDINQSGTHLLEIINDILDLSKVEANKMELMDGEAHLIDMVSPALSILNQKIVDKELQLTMDAEKLENICMKVDEKLFKQILLNLLSNAIKFTNKGGKIDIDADSCPTKGITVIVKDNGIGMNEEDIPNAMTPFSQVDTGLNRVYEGTGLGLPLVKSFTELHGGKFELLSQLNLGTSAIIRLPISRIVA